ncbi:MAG: hypothetical protein ACTHNH_08645 [Mesorhizobium sp.]
MTTMLDKLFSTPTGSLLSRLSAGGRRRQSLIDVRDLSAYVQRDIGLCDGEEEIARRLQRSHVEWPFMRTEAPTRCVRP